MLSEKSSRLGFFYYPDFNHFTQKNLLTWLPVLSGLNSQWLILKSAASRAVPEPFISGLIQAGLHPVIQLDLSPHEQIDYAGIELLINSYAKWGVQYLWVFDRPNTQSFWKSQMWVQTDLVERFLDIYVPLAEIISRSGIINIFPPLEPAGSYWDLAFLKQSLLGIMRRGKEFLLQNLILSAYSDIKAADRSLDWGLGGPERWSDVQPYLTPEHMQDQRGLYIFDWYTTAAHSITGKLFQTILFEMPRKNHQQGKIFENIPEEEYSRRVLAITQALNSTGELDSGEYDQYSIAPLPENIISFNFHRLAGSGNDAYPNESWFKSDGTQKPIVELLMGNKTANFRTSHDTNLGSKTNNKDPNTDLYLLLPALTNHKTINYLKKLEPYLLENRPRIGFSYNEAILSKRVTLIDQLSPIDEEQIHGLMEAGCQVDWIDFNGMRIASNELIQQAE